MTVITPPAVEPITLTEAKLWLKVDGDAENDLIEVLISAAREVAEHYTNRKFITTTVAETFGVNETFTLSLGTLQAVTIVTVDGQTLDEGEYEVTTDDYGCKVVVFNTAPASAPTITYTVGYGDAASDVPKAVIQAMQLTIAEFYENRADRSRRLPTASQFLLNTERRWVT